MFPNLTSHIQTPLWIYHIKEAEPPNIKAVVGRNTSNYGTAEITKCNQDSLFDKNQPNLPHSQVQVYSLLMGLNMVPNTLYVPVKQFYVFFSRK